MPKTNNAGVIRFGVFEADLRSGELRKSGVKIRLREQAFQVLSELLERPGEVVTREELRDRLWPDGTFVDFDHSLNAAVNSIREVLGDSAASPRFVETMPRRGYRFIASVEGPGQSAPGAVDPLPKAQTASEPATTLDPALRRPDRAGEDTSTDPRKHRVRVRQAIWAVTLIAVVALAAASYQLWNRPEPQVQPSPKKTYLTSYPLRELQPSFSPDASQVTFAWEGEGPHTFDIYVKLIGVEPPRRITTNPLQEYNPVWSPDGRWIAFLRRLDESNAEVRLVDPFGNRERKLAEVSVKAGFGTRHLAWSPDSKGLVFVDDSPPAESGSLFLVSIDTGEKRQLTDPPVGTYLDANPSFSPDGSRLAFSRFVSGVGTTGDLFILDPSRDRSSEADLQRLSFDSLTRDVAGWTPSGAHVVYLLGDPRVGILKRVGIYGTSEPELLAALGWVGLFPAPALSSDGKRLVYADSFFDTAITRLQLSDGPTQPVATKLIDSTRLDLYGEYSPDGSRIAFSSDRSGDFEIWVSELDGSKPVQLTSLSSSSAGLCSDPRWSPDGDQILFAAVREGLRYIWVVSSEGGAARPLTSGQSIDLQANWSRDGEWVYFTSNRGDQFDVWKVRFDGGDPFQVTTTGGANATESVDGEWLFYIKDPSPTWETSLWRIPARGGPEEKVLETIIRSYFVAEDGIFFISQTHPIHGRDSSYSDAYLQLYRFESRESEVIAAVKMGWKSEGLSVSADGRSFLFTDAVQEAGDLVMLEDFQ